MKKLTLAPVLLILGSSLVGCSGTTTTSSAPVSAPASSSAAATPSTSATSGATTPSASASSSSSSSSTANEPSDVCALLSVAEVNQLAGTKFVAQSKGDNRCTYSSTKSGSTSTDDFGMLTGIKATTEPLPSLAASEKASFGSGATSKSIEVKGATEAILVTGKDASNNASSVLTERDGLLYLVVIGGQSDTATYTSAATKVMEALLSA